MATRTRDSSSSGAGNSVSNFQPISYSPPSSLSSSGGNNYSTQLNQPGQNTVYTHQPLSSTGTQTSVPVAVPVSISDSSSGSSRPPPNTSEPKAIADMISSGTPIWEQAPPALSTPSSPVSAPPVQSGPTPEEIAAEQARLAAEAQAKAQAEAAAKAAAEKAARDAANQAAYDRALKYGNEQITNNGLNQGLIDQYGVLDAYKKLVDTRRSELGDNAGDFSQYGVENYWRDTLSGAENRYRSDLKNSITGVAGDGFENNWFADTADDPLLTKILEQQRADADTILNRAKARGQLNDVGYGRAMNELNTQGSAGMSNLQSLGGGVLAEYRKQLGDTRNQGLTSAGTASFSSPFNTGSITERLNALRNDFSGRLEGDINRAVGGTSFFTPTSAIGKGGTVQGTINPSKINFNDNPLLSAFQTASARKAYGNNTGSLATTGAF